MIDKQLGPYRILSKLGEGGMEAERIGRAPGQLLEDAVTSAAGAAGITAYKVVAYERIPTLLRV